MSNYDPNLRGPEYTPSRVTPAGWGTGSWITGAAIAVLLLIAIGYVFSDRTATNSSMVEHRAAATDSTDTTAPTAAPVKPMNPPAAAPAAPAPSTTPKP